MIISPRKSASKSGVGILGSLIAIVGGACAFLVMLQDYTHATMSHPLAQIDPSATATIDPPIFISSSEGACFSIAAPKVAEPIKHVILAQILAARSGDVDTVHKYVNVPLNGACTLHISTVENSCKRVAATRDFAIDRVSVSHDGDQSLVYCHYKGAHSEKHAVYTVILNQLDHWRVQNIAFPRSGDAYAIN